MEASREDIFDIRVFDHWCRSGTRDGVVQQCDNLSADSFHISKNVTVFEVKNMSLFGHDYGLSL